MTSRTRPRTDTSLSGVERPASFRVLPASYCFELLATTVVGRIAFAGSAGLQLLPVNYRVFEETVLVRTARGGTLAELVDRRSEVLFEADYHAPVARHGWSVVVRGTSTAVRDPRVLASPECGRLRPRASSADGLVLQIHPQLVTGRQVSLR